MVIKYDLNMSSVLLCNVLFSLDNMSLDFTFSHKYILIKILMHLILPARLFFFFRTYLPPAHRCAGDILMKRGGGDISMRRSNWGSVSFSVITCHNCHWETGWIYSLRSEISRSRGSLYFSHHCCLCCWELPLGNSNVICLKIFIYSK